MADKKITDLPVAATLGGTDAQEVVQGGVSKQNSIEQTKSYTYTALGVGIPIVSITDKLSLIKSATPGLVSAYIEGGEGTPGDSSTCYIDIKINNGLGGFFTNVHLDNDFAGFGGDILCSGNGSFPGGYVKSNTVLDHNDIQILTEQQPAIADSVDLTDVVATLNTLLAELRTHGLIGT